MIVQILVAIISTLAFAVLFHVPRQEYLYCAVNGGLGPVTWLGSIPDVPRFGYRGYRFKLMVGFGFDIGGKNFIGGTENAQYGVFAGRNLYISAWFWCVLHGVLSDYE